MFVCSDIVLRLNSLEPTRLRCQTPSVFLGNFMCPQPALSPSYAVVLHGSGVGEVNKIVFANPSTEKAFGVPKQSDPEGARDLTMMWQEHALNPDDVPGAQHTRPQLLWTITMN